MYLVDVVHTLYTELMSVHVLVILYPCRPELPDFHLDFGFVVYGMVVSRTLHLTNVGHCPVSFTTAHRQLQDSGFTVDLGDKIRALPPREKLEFTVTFDPAAIKCPKGKTTTVLPFNVGPMCMEFYRHSGQSN